MVSSTGIEWTDATFNPWIGWTKVSAGCKNCYAAPRMPRHVGLVAGRGAQIDFAVTDQQADAVTVQFTVSKKPFYATEGMIESHVKEMRAVPCVAESTSGRRLAHLLRPDCESAAFRGLLGDLSAPYLAADPGV